MEMTGTVISSRECKATAALLCRSRTAHEDQVCFSAAASFTAAGALAAIGGVSIAAAADKHATLFAAVPLGFAAQQASEGVVWLTINSPVHHVLHRAAVFTFLIFALVLWPTWIPVAVERAERDDARRRWLGRFRWLGIVV